MMGYIVINDIALEGWVRCCCSWVVRDEDYKTHIAYTCPKRNKELDKEFNRELNKEFGKELNKGPKKDHNGEQNEEPNGELNEEYCKESMPQTCREPWDVRRRI